MKSFIIMPDTAGLSYEDRRFNAAFDSILNMDRMDYPNWMGGIKFASGESFPAGSPIDNDILIGNFQEPEPGMADRAVSYAADAFQGWSARSMEERIEVMKEVRSRLIKARFRMAAAICVAVGSTKDQSLSEMERLRDFMDGCLESAAEESGDPMGVWAVLSDYHSPVAAPFASVFAALLAGNTVVLMPSHLCAFPAHLIYKIFAECGIPDGALNMIVDRRGKEQQALIDNPDLAGVSLSGSGEDFEDTIFAQVDPDIRYRTEIAGMNPALITQRSDLEYATEAILKSAFTYTGQRLDSCSKVIILEQHYEQFLNLLIEGARNMKVDDPADLGSFTGPVIDANAVDKFLQTVGEAKSYLVFGGKRLTDNFLGDGQFVMPAIMAGLPDDHDLNVMGHSMPILSVQRASSLEEAIEMINDCEFGPSAGIFSKDESEIEAFLAGINAESAYVNSPSIEPGPAANLSLRDFQA